MKITYNIFPVLLSALFLICLSDCKKRDTLAVVITNEVTDFGLDYAVLGGEVISDGGSYVTAEGACWSTHQNPTLEDLSFSRGTGNGGFSNRVSLNTGETYYIRAYAVNSVGTAYGNQVTVTIPAILPTVFTAPVTILSSTTASSGGNISSDGGAIIARGVCWSTSHNPTITDNKTTDGAGMGYFTSSITFLVPNIAYYLRAYATNSAGTGYGNEISFAIDQPTGPTVTDIDGNVYHTVTIGAQVWMVENLRTTHFRNGDPIPTSTEDSGMPGKYDDINYWDYNRDANNSVIYGRLYGWLAASDSRNIAPEGWHVPSDSEWTTLTDWLTNNGYGYEGSGNDIAKSMAARSGWYQSPQAGNVGNHQESNNSSGFMALPGGCYLAWYNPQSQTGGWKWSFSGLGYDGHWWSIKNPALSYIIVNGISYNGSTFINNDYDGRIRVGVSVRCIKD